jgi:hypothetical protein
VRRYPDFVDIHWAQLLYGTVLSLSCSALTFVGNYISSSVIQHDRAEMTPGEDLTRSELVKIYKIRMIVTLGRDWLGLEKSIINGLSLSGLLSTDRDFRWPDMYSTVHTVVRYVTPFHAYRVQSLLRGMFHGGSLLSAHMAQVWTGGMGNTIGIVSLHPRNSRQRRWIVVYGGRRYVAIWQSHEN